MNNFDSIPIPIPFWNFYFDSIPIPKNRNDFHTFRFDSNSDSIESNHHYLEVNDNIEIENSLVESIEARDLRNNLVTQSFINE